MSRVVPIRPLAAPPPSLAELQIRRQQNHCQAEALASLTRRLLTEMNPTRVILLEDGAPNHKAAKKLLTEIEQMAAALRSKL